ncbi:MAG: glycerol-3-phosphate dehydrogenase [Fulvimarina manganoxydans]|uniref:glycerol-3-phosphate dehydrogenase n=1 Tax=Fulvimarina manganoxydans TaxID=937218 RepID=UPI0023571546|nr:glycerol-3-phosphate dehydrogenase [Fulvimarina manganoxydans]MCK5934279.1 glycerol-3-phosphate dehydrogenase [Fulvimarina manganoxydans]
MADYDVFIVGGGINGCGIARDAAGCGYKVGLVEMNDLASGTSSWSTKLIHGGLRYLEHYEFRLVREALKEREVLWAIAPHIIRPLRFILPHHDGLRPAWLLRLGLFLYDNLGGRKRLPATRTVDLSKPLGSPLKSDFSKGFEYSDARVDDARLVVLNARDAAERGADIRTRTKLVSARRANGEWRLKIKDQTSGEAREVSARLLVNVAGPWVDEVIRGAVGRKDAHNIRLVQGSHIVTRKLYDHDRAYIFQNSDGRIIFAIPYEDDFTLIGTTDRDYEGDPGKAAISTDEIDYLVRSASEYFEQPVSRDDIVWTFSGVRPLFDDGASKAQEATRDYVLKHETEGAPLVNAFGGKITTYRRLSEDVTQMIGKSLDGHVRSWTGKEPLPGGNFGVEEIKTVEAKIAALASDLDARSVKRLARSYGLDAIAFLERAKGDLGADLGHGLRGVEVDWLIAAEWALTAEDVLWRRSKLGLRFTKDETERLEAFMAERARRETAAA